MIIQQKIGNINSASISNRSIDWLALEWYETSKRILRKKTKAGKEISFYMKMNRRSSPLLFYPAR
jgi:urease accessory protein